MGLRGPAPTPTAILKARGSWRADLRVGEVEYEKGIPTCPSWLAPEGKQEWKRQSVHLEAAGLLQMVDRAALALYCEAWAEFVMCVKAIKQRANLEESGRLVKIKNEAADRVLRLAGQFGFTPAARVRLKGAERPEEQQSGKARFFA